MGQQSGVGELRAEHQEETWHGLFFNFLENPCSLCERFECNSFPTEWVVISVFGHLLLEVLLCQQKAGCQ